MSLFSAETIVNALISGLGIKPADLQATMQIVARLQSTLGEVDAFKSGAIQMVQHFNARLDRIEAQLARIEANQWDTDTALPHGLPKLSNGATNHE